MHEVMHCLHPSVQWQQQQSNNFPIENMNSLQSGGVCYGWPNLTSTVQSPIPVTTRVAATTTTTMSTTVSNNSASLVQVGAEKKNAKKRKARKSPPLEGNDDGDEVSKLTEDDAGDSSNSKDNNNAKKQDYIHVRARRGQATDSHSLAERVRRERISERMKYLQGLVPGCNKITGKAGMLDEIINYVQSLQRQVEFLSLKLAASNPLLEFNMEALFSEEMNLQCSSVISTQGTSTDTFDPLLLQFNTLQQALGSFGHGLAMNPAEVALRRATSMPVSVSEPFLDSSFNVQRTISDLNSELDNLCGVEFQQGRGSVFPIQAMQGNTLPNNRRMDM